LVDIRGDDETDIRFAVAQGTLQLWPINFGAFCSRRNWTHSLVALVFQNGMQYRLVNASINSITNASTSCKSWWTSVQ